MLFQKFKALSPKILLIFLISVVTMQVKTEIHTHTHTHTHTQRERERERERAESLLFPANMYMHQGLVRIMIGHAGGSLL